MEVEEEQKSPLTLKERIALLQNSTQSTSTSTSTPSTTGTSSSNQSQSQSQSQSQPTHSKGIALIGLGSSLNSKVPSSLTVKEDELNKSNNNNSKGGEVDSNRSVQINQNEVNSSIKPASIPLFNYTPYSKSSSTSQTNNNSRLSSNLNNSNSSSSPVPSLQSIIQPSRDHNTKQVLSKTDEKELPVGNANSQVSKTTTTIPSISQRSIPIAVTKPQWLSNQSSTVPTVAHPLDSISQSVNLPTAPKIPSRSNTLRSSASSSSASSIGNLSIAVESPIIPPRPKQSINSSYSVPSLPTEITSTARLNKHRAPSNEFDSISLSKESTSKLIDSLIVEEEPVIKFRPTVTSTLNSTSTSNSTNSKTKSVPPTFPPRISTTNLINNSNPTTVSSVNLISSNLSTYSTRSPLSPLTPTTKMIDSKSRIRYKLLFEKLMIEVLNRNNDRPAWIKEKEKLEGRSGGKGERLDGEIVKWVWEKSKLKKEMLRNIWNECDTNKKGSLNEEEFIKGLNFIDEELRRRSK